ncbi:hypothetical protein EMPG_16793 [Blastomyces silverae]|uniref:Uncharacterized protein n=1 Tax=Blastomyces silverae TaxID=2060906 RepID=A0A0H1B8J4_9EURO|nr:hypothetical protein EMPG_16793 [Blastomyces silverae]
MVPSNPPSAAFPAISTRPMSESSVASPNPISPSHDKLSSGSSTPAGPSPSLNWQRAPFFSPISPP